MPALPISVFKFFSKCFRFKKSSGLLFTTDSTDFPFSIGSFERKISCLFSNNSTKILSSCPCKVSLMSLFIGSAVVNFSFGYSALSIAPYFCTASCPAASLSKKKTISSNCGKSFTACWCSSVNPFVP